MGAVKEFLIEMECAAANGDREAIRYLIRNGVCPHCGEQDFTYRWRLFRDGRCAIEVRCSSGCFIEWALQTPQNIEKANNNSSPWTRA